MASLAEIRSRIQAQENKQLNKNINNNSDTTTYHHWNMGEGTTASLRFLPDGDQKNTFFWVERQTIKLPFNGIKGQTNAKRLDISVPCVEMFNDGTTCPILTEVRAWYRDESLKEMANKYWKKRSYIFQGFVRQNPIGDDRPPANPIRKFIISPQIFTIIKSSLMDPEMEDLPTDYTNGLDFNIKKTTKGTYADYSTSNWTRKVSALTQVEQDAIEAFGLFNLADFLPKKPSEAELKIIKEMFDASVEGKPYDVDRWGSYYTPYGIDLQSTSSESGVVAQPSVEQRVEQPSVEHEENTVTAVTVKPTQTSTSSDKAQDILQLIRSRQQNKA